jgi:hypothetical protein
MEKILTTNEIFQESMKLSGPAYEEKGEKLEEYQKWLQKKWMTIEEIEKIIKNWAKVSCVDGKEKCHECVDELLKEILKVKEDKNNGNNGRR